MCPGPTRVPQETPMMDVPQPDEGDQPDPDDTDQDDGDNGEDDETA